MSGCVVCTKGEAKTYKGYKWNFWGVDYKLAECDACETVFTDPMPDDETLSKVYSTCFDYRWYEDHYAAKYRDCITRLNEYKGILGKRVLDFGGGVGYFSKAAEGMGYISRTYDPFMKKDDKIKEKWDTVVALHVLEHSNDLDRTVAQIKDLLESDGNVIITVPNRSGIGYREMDMNWVWAQPPLLHIFHFTEQGLRNLFERHGFSGIKVSYHERWDANSNADIKKARLVRLLDSLWGRTFINKFRFSRKLVAHVVSGLRYRWLTRGSMDYRPDDKSYAELQIIASLNNRKSDGHG